MPSSSWEFFSYKGRTISLRSDIVTTGAAVAIGRIGGLVIPFALAATYGASRQTDIFFVIWGIMLAFIMVAGHLFETVLVPHLSRSANSGESSIDAVVSGVLKATAIPLLLFVTVCAFSIRPVFEFVSDWSQEDIQSASRIFWLMAPVPLCATVASVCLGALNASGSYTWGAISPLCRTVPPALFLAFTQGEGDISGLAVAYLLGELLRGLLGMIGYHLAGYRFTFASQSKRFSSATYRTAWQQVFGFTGICLFPIVTQMQASSLGVGEVSVLAYAQHLRNIPQLLLMTAFGTVLLTDWSALRSRIDAYKVVYRDLTNAVMWTVCCTGIMLVIIYPITTYVLTNQAIPEARVLEFSWLFALLALSLPFDVLGYLAARFLIVNDNHRSFVALAYMRLFVVFICNLVLLPRLQIMGIGVSLIVANGVYAGLVMTAMRFNRINAQRPREVTPESTSLPAREVPC